MIKIFNVPNAYQLEHGKLTFDMHLERMFDSQLKIKPI